MLPDRAMALIARSRPIATLRSLVGSTVYPLATPSEGWDVSLPEAEFLEPLMRHGLFDHYEFAGTSRPEDGTVPDSFCWNYPKAFIADALDAEALPDWRRVISDSPVPSSAILPEQAATVLGQAGLGRILEVRRRHGLGAPLCVSFGVGAGGMGFMVLSKREGMTVETASLLAALGPSLHAGVLREVGRSRAPASVPITNRERECLAWASVGKSSEDIADILGISKVTADLHFRNATRRLGTQSRMHAVAEALRRGIID